MISVLTSLIIALVATAAFTPMVRRMAFCLKAVDEPAARRVHSRSIPRLGGLAIVAGVIVAVAALFVLDTEVAQLLIRRKALVLGMATGGIGLAALGAWDDVVGITAKRKLFVQSLAAVFAYACGFRINAIYLPGIGVAELGILALPATCLWITAVVNALNLIDGLDGLAAGAALFACVANFVTSWLMNDVLTCMFAATLAGALLGFLFYNFNPATIFMGDSGSMFLGFVLAVMSIFGAGADKGSTAIALIVPTLALGLPIMDMLITMVRRILARRSMFSPDRGHIHHRLLDAGLTHRRAVILLYGLCCVFTLGALALHLGRSWQIGVSLTVLVGAVFGIARFLGHFNRLLSSRGQRERHNEDDVECLRRAVPAWVARMHEGHVASRDLPAMLEDFARTANLFALRLSPATHGVEGAYRYSADGLGPRSLSEAVSATYDLQSPPGSHWTLEFVWDSPQGEVSPQCDILLQLVGDVVEQVLNVDHRVAVSRAEPPDEGEPQLALVGRSS